MSACTVCGRPVPKGQSRCAAHSKDGERPSSARRGYGRAHQELRRTWAAKVAAGGVLCARCGQPIEPGSPWDLGHLDDDRSRYSGPEHAGCNRATSTHRAAQR